MKRDGIRVAGHIGTWYVIDEQEYEGRTLFLLEHEKYGDEAAWVIVDGDGNLVCDEAWDGFDSLE